MALFSFDPASVEASSNAGTRAPLPKGLYEAIVMDSEIKTTKAGDGQYIELVIQIVDGQFSGRRIWERLNVSNPNKTAEKISKEALSSLCGATGVTLLNDTTQLHDRPFTLELDIDRKDPSRNRVMSYAPPLTAGARIQHAAQASSAPAGGSKKPWEK